MIQTQMRFSVKIAGHDEVKLSECPRMFYF